MIKTHKSKLDQKPDSNWEWFISYAICVYMLCAQYETSMDQRLNAMVSELVTIILVCK